jgi:hypothetical protein
MVKRISFLCGAKVRCSERNFIQKSKIRDEAAAATPARERKIEFIA